MTEQKEKVTTNNKSLTTTIIVAVIVAALAFYGGIKYQQSKARSLAGAQAGFGGGQFGRRGGAGANGARPIGGDIVSKDDKSITVKLMDGSTKIILLSDKTVINKATTGTKDDLQTGDRVTAFGITNSDGSVTAQTVAIGGGMFRGGGPRPSEAPAGN